MTFRFQFSFSYKRGKSGLGLGLHTQKPFYVPESFFCQKHSFFKNYPHKDFVNPGINRVEILCSESERTRFFEDYPGLSINYLTNKQSIHLIIMAGGNTVKEMTRNFGKLDKFQGQDFRRWQKKMHFMLTTLKVVHVLSTPIPEIREDDTVENLRRRSKWENDDYICRGHILNVHTTRIKYG
ncbi:uncharacterized protein LOC127118602 [Lathyrus oleraceus]|uniref:uncharacterized protein LOC127118602 n=1 Tax=Pisum sativum TaxID=3888 RepID=UPI0021D3D23C|nr:uncharacterized protein LOC127118602 [Pisum sativum]